MWLESPPRGPHAPSPERAAPMSTKAAQPAGPSDRAAGTAHRHRRASLRRGRLGVASRPSQHQPSAGTNLTHFTRRSAAPSLGGRKAVPGVRTSRAGTSRARDAKQQLTALTNDGIVAAAETEAAGRTDPLGRQRDSEPEGKAAPERSELLLGRLVTWIGIASSIEKRSS